MAISNNTEKINELITKINSLPIAGAGGSGADGKDGFSPIITVQQVTGGHNIIITDIDGTETFFVADGKDGKDGRDGSSGKDGVGISSIKQTTTSTANGGTNVITATLSNGQTSTFNIKNGAKGSNGTSCTHSWDGTTLNVTSASGTSSANLVGPKGDDGSDGMNGVSVTKVEQTTTSSADGGTNVITVTLSDGNTFSFNIKNGSRGGVGPGGVGITSIKQTTTSNADDGTNVITATLSNGQTSTFNIKNGSMGSKGSDATINGVNALTLDTDSGITSYQDGESMTIGASLTGILASGPIILKEGVDYHYGNELPPTGYRGRLFFLRTGGN